MERSSTFGILYLTVLFARSICQTSVLLLTEIPMDILTEILSVSCLRGLRLQRSQSLLSTNAAFVLGTTFGVTFG